MARGTAIADVSNILQSGDITGQEKIPAMSTGGEEPQVVTTGELKDYINGELDVLTNMEIESLLT